MSQTENFQVKKQEANLHYQKVSTLNKYKYLEQFREIGKLIKGFYKSKSNLQSCPITLSINET